MSSPSCKVDSAIRKYSLTPPGDPGASINDHLVARWTGKASFEEIGYKQLTRWFNEHILTTVYEAAGRSTVGSRISGDYDILQGDDEILRDELIADLATDDIDAVALIDDMVSWSTMRRHLKGCLSVEKEPKSARTDWETRTVDIARERLEEKLSQASRSLGSKDELIGGGNVEVHFEAYLGCPECNVRVPFSVARDRGYVCEAHVDDSSGVDRPSDDVSGNSAPKTARDAGGR